MAKINCFLEMEIGITGGEEDGVDNTGVKAEALYTKPEQARYVSLFTLFSPYRSFLKRVLFLL